VDLSRALDQVDTRRGTMMLIGTQKLL